jgi:5-methylthioadenosine/S-adenosylhomocysteine deaminase
MGLLVENALTVTMDRENRMGPRWVLVKGDRIARVSARPLRPGAADRVIRGEGRVLIPGLFNCHVHGDMTLARGLGDGYTLYQQDYDSPVSRSRWFRGQLDREARRLSRLLQYAEAVKGGVTGVCDVPFWWEDAGELAGPIEETGLRGWVVLDYRPDFGDEAPMDRGRYLAQARALADRGHVPIVEAPAEEGFEPELLAELMGRARELDTLVHLHLAETAWRRDLVRRRFGTTPVRFLRDIGFLNERVLGSHGVHLDDEEIALLGDAGARIVNCPVAEMKIADGVAPVVKLLRAGVPLCLGTDGALWNDAGDLFAEMKSLLLLQRVSWGASSLQPVDCLRAATSGAARALGRESDLGSIEEGKRADLVLVDFMKPHLVPLYHGERSNLLANLVTCARAQDVDTVVAGGRVVVEHGRLLTLDEHALVERCQRLAEKRFGDLHDTGHGAR